MNNHDWYPAFLQACVIGGLIGAFVFSLFNRIKR